MVEEIACKKIYFWNVKLLKRAANLDEGFDENEQPEENNQDAPAAPAANNDNIGRDMLDDMTWHRLLGLDGSFVFIEHVFWVISLNIVFTVVFSKFI